MKHPSINTFIDQIRSINRQSNSLLAAEQYNQAFTEFFNQYADKDEAILALKIGQKPIYIRANDNLKGFPKALYMMQHLTNVAAKRADFSAVLVIWQPFKLNVQEYPFRVLNVHSF